MEEVGVDATGKLVDDVKKLCTEVGVDETGAACGICRQHNGTKNGRVNAETPAKKKPRLA